MAKVRSFLKNVLFESHFTNKSYKTKLKNQFPFGTSRVTLDTLALVQRFHYRFLSFYLFSKGSQYLGHLVTAHAFLLIKVSHSIYMLII